MASVQLKCFGAHPRVSVKAQTYPLLIRFPVDSNYSSSFDGTRIYYELRGQGKPVLLVHGFMGSTYSWKRTALYRDLLYGGYQVVLLDLRGNGRSDKPPDSTAYEADAEAKDIMGLMQQLRIKQYVAVGYSRGAIITVFYFRQPYFTFSNSRDASSKAVSSV